MTLTEADSLHYILLADGVLLAFGALCYAVEQWLLRRMFAQLRRESIIKEAR